MEQVAQFQAQSAYQNLLKCEPEAAEVVKPWLERLFVAFHDGDSCIVLPKHERSWLQDAAPIVGEAHKIDGVYQASTPLVAFAQGQLALGRVWQLEAEIAQHLQRLSRTIIPTQSLANLLNRLFDEPSSWQQKQAAALACLNQLAIITGGPGTGKTTTVAKLLCLLSDGKIEQPRIALAAPTGKAAARMTESLRGSLQRLQDKALISAATEQNLLSLEGKTLHRLLGMMPPKMLPRFHAKHTLPYDIIVIDETSMLDSSMLRHLLAAIDDDTRLILLGDADQLPPVGMGDLLSLLPETTQVLPEQKAVLDDWGLKVDWDSADEVPMLAAQTARLNISHRFKADSGIGQLAGAVLRQEGERLQDLFEQFADIEMRPVPEYTRMLAWHLWLAQQEYWHAVDDGDAADVFAAWLKRMVLTVRRHDAEQINLALREILKQQNRWDESRGFWYHGQAIMITRNHAEMGLFNGDVGVVLRDAKNRLQAYFPTFDGMREVALSRLPQHEDAFAMTVHKSQGSEFAEVWLLPPLGAAEHAEDYDCALLYTAITRAKNKLVYWGDVASLQAASGRVVHRQTVLAYLLSRSTQQKSAS